jgi:hypothetical protein
MSKKTTAKGEGIPTLFTLIVFEFIQTDEED